MKTKLFDIVFWVLLIGHLSCNAAAFELNQSGLAQVCEVSSAVISKKTINSIDSIEQKDFSVDQCEIIELARLDPQNRLLWVRMELNIDPQVLSSLQPLGLFISGKSSSRIFLNGHFIGSNGKPGLTKQQEIPGKIDAVFALNPDFFQDTENQLVMLLSAHHGFLNLAYPINGISIAKYQNPTDIILRHYWPSLLPFGVLLLGSFYLLLMVKMTHLPLRTYLLPIMALVAAAQLFIEVFRGLLSYSYPLHDLRLLLILLCSSGFGMCLLAYVLSMINYIKHTKHLLGLCVSIGFLVALAPGFDLKSLLAIVLPVFIGLIYVAVAWQKGQKNIRFVFMLLLVFLVMIFLNAYTFIDTVYYYFVALLIFMLMAQQAFQVGKLKKLYLKDQARAIHLQQIIEQQDIQNSTEQLEIRSSGKVEWVMIKDIAYCKGAGDYVELILLDGSIKLFHGSVSDLSLCLPITFLKTHRSYLVNTSLVKSLNRSASGAGQLQLSHGFNVPVSRRILPKVRDKLTDDKDK